MNDGKPARVAWFYYLLRDKKALIGFIVLIILLITAVFAPVIAPYDPNAMDFSMMQSPSWGHPLGTDDLSRDLRYRSPISRHIVGSRFSGGRSLTTLVI